MVQEKLEQIVALAQQASTELPVELQAKYDQGFTEGAASVGSELEVEKTKAVAAKLAQLKVAYDAQQVAESQGETGFGSMLV